MKLIFVEKPSSNAKALFIESAFVGMYLEPILDGFRNIGIYDFDPKLPKRSTPITGPSELEMDGSNLAVMINKVISNKEHRRIF